ncbi:mechanosensitive ion channel family protein [Chitinophaga nivalis]|uniref:Mechanosensitive ion channel family protein n=1 Tax=Chitinophaga nivalis TaxID=2991709 RepID=A0ABT3IU74_9BACT|nr:mechanosensitive ion channel family protein [Chitinophaga nivalis]MCW3462797.1 mechanosensitive ion channel family protein [Chitinophaga nivalis]MCW3487513.1 mechanosensitive ion channel family protein [Chitinophaga nivalis]
MQSFLEQKYWGNTVQDYGIALGIFIVAVLLILVFKRILLIRLKKWAAKTTSRIDDFLIRGIERSLVPLLYVGAFYIAIQQLTLIPVLAKWVHIFLSVCLTLFAVRVVTALLQFLFVSYLSGQERGEEKTKQVKGIMILVSAFIWIIGLLFLLDNWGVNVTTFVAGLGIGGIAIALAAQTILGDLFSYFVIFFDRPFEIGDFIVVQDKSGTVEYIGIKTTRLRSISGEQLVFSNTDLTNSRVHNYKRMEKRRIVFKFGVTFNTPKDKLALIPELVKKIITDLPDVAFDRSHLLNFGDSSLVYENVYNVLGGDYNLYMDRQQAINLQLFAAFAKEGISFAFPTTTVYLNNNTTTEKI